MCFHQKIRSIRGKTFDTSRQVWEGLLAACAPVINCTGRLLHQPVQFSPHPRLVGWFCLYCLGGWEKEDLGAWAAWPTSEKGDVVPACTAPRGVPPRYPILGGRASGHALLVSVLRDQPLGNARGSSPAKLAARCVKRDSAPGCPTRGDIIMCHTADQQPHACSETVCNGQSPDRLGVSWQRGTSILAWQWTFPRSLARPLPESACPAHPQAAQGRPSKTGQVALGGVAGTESLNFQPSALSTNP